MFQGVVVVGIFPLTDLCVHGAAHSFVPNRDDCKWLWGTTDGWWTARTHGTSMHLACSDSPAAAHSLQRDLCLQWRAAARGSLSAADLKRQNATPLWEVNRHCSSLLQATGSWQTLKTTNHLSDAKAWKLQRRLECASARSESWDVPAVPARFIVFLIVIDCKCT